MKRKTTPKAILILNLLLGAALLIFANSTPKLFPEDITRLLCLALIYCIAAMSLNLINGFTGMFSLGHAGFMAIGAYTTAILTLSPQDKKSLFIIEPIWQPLLSLNTPLWVSLLIGGVIGALFALLVGFPVLKLKGDYLAVASLGFSEILVILFTNITPLTNGATGLSRIPPLLDVTGKGQFMTAFWPMLFFLITFIVLKRFINSSYGRALKAIREDEIAAEAMGINLQRHKTLSFVTGAFFASLSGGLLAAWGTSINPVQFKFIFTYQILLIVVIGGMGSLSGSIIASFLYAFGMEKMRIIDDLSGVTGLRMVVFSVLLIVVVLFFRRGIMGTREITWQGLIHLFQGRTKRVKEAGDHGEGE
ncbi:Branched-chain amino acid transport system permease protein LivM [Clostridiaceae bacterium JG1575]|nr:Branched-chain amino acid transport system permease protein LivM [Clostridiaceae bacterium JG1575]